MKYIQKQNIFFAFFVSLFLISVAPYSVPTAYSAEEPCQKLSGDTAAVEIITFDDKGKQYVDYNSGQNFFEGKAPSTFNRPVFLAPDAQAACAQKVGDTVYLKGWFWNNNLGWISLYCPGDGGGNRGVQCGFVKYGVQIDNFGNLSGYAWSTVGWIRFTCKATPGYNDETICADSLFKVKVDFNAPANNRTWFPYIYAWSNTVGWFMFDSIHVPWFTLPDTQTPECKNNVNKCLREKDLTSEEKFFIQANEEEAKGAGPGPGGGTDLKEAKLIPGTLMGDDDFPVTWNKIRYLGNTAGSSSGTKALNPVTQADVRNLIFRNVMRWKKVASSSCGDKGGYLTKFSAADQVFYCKGDVHLNATANNWKGNKTIIVEDGNIYIEGNLYSDGGQFGLIALKKNLLSSKNGNVFIYPSVREMRVQMYADGFVLPANASGTVASGNDYSINGDGKNETLFGQLYIRGMIISANSGSYPADGSTVPPSDLSALRSVPASPFDEKPIKWSDYFDAINEEKADGGKYVATAPIKKTETVNGEKVTKKDAKGKIEFEKDPKTNNEKKEKQTFVPQIKHSEKKVKEIQAAKTPSKTRLKEEPTTYTEGVILQFEPPSNDLGGFEGTLGNTYRQTR